MNQANVVGNIEFPNTSCFALWVAEISGQLSDGMWENTAPMDHWKFWCHLEPKVGGCRVVLNANRFVPYRQKTGYNIAALYEYVGDRMVAYGRMGRALQSLGINEPGRETIEGGEYLAPLANMQEFEKALDAGNGVSDYVRSKLANVDREHAAAFFATRYEMKDLRKDVALIKAAMKTVKS
jgi:hypothetical protein